LTVKGGVCLKAIIRRRNAFAVFTALGVTISVLIIICGIRIPEIPTRLLLAVSIPSSAWLAVYWIQEYRKLQTAQLIVENRILHICTASAGEGDGDTAKPENVENTEVFISYFGILLDTKIIRFNQDKIFLKAVEIGRDFISLSYGTDKRVQNIRFLRTVTSSEELENIVKQFRDETGIVPVITD
jgi:hypothetical protein